MNEILCQIDVLTKDYRYLKEEWKVGMSEVEICENAYLRAKESIQINSDKLRKNVLKCVVVGRVSAGKSALINALLSRNILPSYPGPTTNSFVEIHKSDDGTNYVVFADSPDKRRDISCIDVVDEESESPVVAGSHVDLYYSGQECPLLKDDVVIVDTPGIDSGLEMDAAIQKECKGADVLIMVVSSENGLGKCERNFLVKHKREFSKFDVIIVFNKWEEIHSGKEERWRSKLKKYSDEGVNCLFEYFQVTEEDAKKRIFFLSAKERLNNLDDNRDYFTQDRDDRNANFDGFIHQLKESLAESSMTRRRRRMEEISNAMIAICDQILSNRYITSSRLCGKISDNLKKFNTLKESIILEIDALFEVMFEAFFSKALRVTKVYCDEDAFVIENRLQHIVIEAITVAVESTKIKITEKLQHSDVENKEYVLKILERLYIPFYFDHSKEFKTWNLTEVRDKLKKIDDIIKKYTVITIAGAALGSGAVLAACGATAGALAPFATATAAPIFGGAGAMAGGGFAGGMSYAILKRRALAPRYKEHEDGLKEMWNSVKKLITKSFDHLYLDINQNVDDLFKPLENRLNDIRKEWLEINRNMQTNILK